GWCGDRQVIPTLEKVYQDTTTPDLIRRIAVEALLKLWDDATKANFQASLIDTLPNTLQPLVQQGPVDELITTLNAYLDGATAEQFAVLETLYLIDNSYTRSALSTLLRTAPLRPNYFQRIRHIFKAAEYRQDSEVFGLLAYRFAKTRQMFTMSYGNLKTDKHGWWTGVGTEDGWIRNGHEEIRKPESRIAFGNRTRAYLRRRVWRTLNQLGQDNDPKYIDLAVELLLQYTDADAKPTSQSFHYDYRVNRYVTVDWDSYADDWVFNKILYTNSRRYDPKPQSLRWACVAPYQPGQLAPPEREEAFPLLWTQQPEALLRLALESDCQPVQLFAIKALRECPDFLKTLEIESLIQLLRKPYEETAKFAFELAQSHYQASNPQTELLLAVANCAFPEARAQAQQWIEENHLRFLADETFVVALITSDYPDIREFTRNWLASEIVLDSTADIILEQLIAYLLTCDETQIAVVQDIDQTIQTCFERQAQTLDLTQIVQLLGYPLVEVREIGAKLLLNHNIKADALPEGLMSTLIASPDESIRKIGLVLFGQLSDDTLLEQESLLISFATHEHADIRQMVRPIMQRLALKKRAFAMRLSALFVHLLQQAEPHEGAHTDLAQILQEDLGQDWKEDVTPNLIADLIQAPSTAAQTVADHLIQAKIEQDPHWATQFETELMVDLADKEVLALRLAAQTLFMKNRSRFQVSSPNHTEALAVAIRWLDSNWEDSRHFGFDFFRTQLTSEDFTPAILVSICDSVRPDVQQFGRALVTTYFEEADGQDYLLKLSEHPSAEMQRFATTYLEGYATDHLDRLQTLKPYFISVLSRVNKARVAKSHVMAFLLSESLKSEAAAQLVIEILTRQSATIVIGDKANTIEALLKIHQTYPHLSVPIRVREPEVRHAV
ncbi:MAG: hypothetical protein AAF485_02505, partial [Chloroflexota bacterium]